MKKILLILTIIAITLLGFTLYFLSSPERQVTETFSSFSFRNDPVERPTVLNEDGTYGVDGTIGEVTESEESEDGWFMRFFRGGDDTDTHGDSSSGTEDTQGTESGQGTGDTTGGTDTGSTGGASPSEGETSGSTGAPTDSTDTGTDSPTAPTTSDTTPTPGTLTVVSPKAGDVLSNKTCPTTGDTVCYERPIATVLWTYSDQTAKITVELHNKSGLVRALTTKTSNSGRYTWNPSVALPDGDYKLVLTAYSTTGTLLTSAATGYFEVSKVKEASTAPAEPSNPRSPSTPIVIDWTYETPTPTSYDRQQVYAGAPLKVTNGEQVFLENPSGVVASMRFVFSQEYEQGTISVVEIPGNTTGYYDIWISKTPGGEPLPKLGKMTVNGLGGPITFYHPSAMVTKGGRVAAGQFPFLDHGTYYYNLDPTDPTGSSVAMTLNRPADWYSVVPSGISKKTPLVCTNLTKNLELDDNDAEVKKLQEFLNASGFPVAVLFGEGAPGEESTSFSKKTAIAVERFQMRYDLSVTGTVNAETRSMIQSLSCD